MRALTWKQMNKRLASALIVTENKFWLCLLQLWTTFKYFLLPWGSAGQNRGQTNPFWMDRLRVISPFSNNYSAPYKLKYFGHVVRAKTLSTGILQCRINGTRSRGRPKRRWSDDVKNWTGLSIPECITMARDRTAWRSFVSSSLVFNLQKERKANNNNNNIAVFVSLEAYFSILQIFMFYVCATMLPCYIRV